MRTLIALATAGVLAAAPLPGHAQTAPAAPMTSPAAVPGTQSTTAPAASLAATPATADSRRMMDRVERHIADLRRRFAVTPAQEPHWTAFADVMRQNARRMEASYASRTTTVPAKMTAVDDLKSYAALERARAEDVERLIPAFDTLYQSMSPTQRASADKTFHDFQRNPRKG